jgi:hypothetical protein
MTPGISEGLIVRVCRACMESFHVSAASDRELCLGCQRDGADLIKVVRGVSQKADKDPR